MVFHSTPYIALLGCQLCTLAFTSPLGSFPIPAVVDFPADILDLTDPAPTAVSTYADTAASRSPSQKPSTIQKLTSPTLPPTDPFTIRFQGSPQSVVFYWEQFLKQNRVEQVIAAAEYDISQHPPTSRMHKGGRDEYKYSAGKTDLVVPFAYEGDLLWGQWANASRCVRTYVEMFGPLGFHFNIYDYTLGRWYHSGRLWSDYGQNFTLIDTNVTSSGAGLTSGGVHLIHSVADS